MHNKKLYGTTTVGSKGQIVIPVSAREDFKIDSGDKFYVFGDPAKGFMGLMKADTLEKYIDEASSQIEYFKNLKDQK